MSNLKRELLQKYFNVFDSFEFFFKYPNWGRQNWPEGVQPYSMTLPYRRESLPRPIPTPEEIDQTGVLVSGYGWGPGIVRVNEVYAVKFSQCETVLREAENLLYLEQHSKIRVPKLYAAFSDDSCNPSGKPHNGETWYYIIMEYIPGQNLETVWKTLPDQRKQEIAVNLMEQLQLLKEPTLPESDRYYGRIHKQAIPPNMHLLRIGEGLRGPYTSYSRLIEDMHLAATFAVITGVLGPSLPPGSAEIISRFKETLASRNERPALVHCDLKLWNMIFREDDKGGFELVIIDWRQLYWFPEWLQAASILQLCTGEEIHKALDQVYSPDDMEAVRFLHEVHDLCGYWIGT